MSDEAYEQAVDWMKQRLIKDEGWAPDDPLLDLVACAWLNGCSRDYTERHGEEPDWAQFVVDESEPEKKSSTSPIRLLGHFKEATRPMPDK